MVVAAACGGDDSAADGAAEATADAELGHVHGLGTNPADGSLFIATHSGLFRAPAGEQTAERVGDSLQDTMGFTVVGEDTFLGSGHPGPGEDGPPLLGLIRSTDAGQSWEPVSLSGEADFHALEAAHDRVYGFDGANGRLMISDDGGETWAEREPPGPLLDIAVHPSEPERLAATSERGVFVSDDDGESWRPVGGEIGFLAWPAEDRLLLIGASGVVQASSDLGASWEELGSIGGQPAALIAESPDELYAALPDGTIEQSTDGGRTWSVRAIPSAG
ncbi:MAG: exo-alpha-sialidase [Thermoleophilaceae bacterium]|nr:exo-alpha-sialidase [Thermoleophilaceae bacterium]